MVVQIDIDVTDLLINLFSNSGNTSMPKLFTLWIMEKLEYLRDCEVRAKCFVCEWAGVWLKIVSAYFVPFTVDQHQNYFLCSTRL